MNLSGKGHPRAVCVNYVFKWSRCYDLGGQKVDISIKCCQRRSSRVTSKIEFRTDGTDYKMFDVFLQKLGKKSAHVLLN